MYKPREDSFLLAKYVEKSARGKVLDIGTGSGILALAAAKSPRVKSVLAADVDKESLAYCNETAINKKITFLFSNLFEKIKGKFDTIIFNPPYIPNEKEMDIRDKALYGGKRGYEIIDRFLDQARSHLSDKGIILFLFSSHTGKDKVDEIIKRKGFKSRLLEKKHIFFEDLFVYSLTA